MRTKRLNRRDFLRLSAVAVTGAIVAACAPATPQIVKVEKEVPVEKEVVRTVEVEKIVEVTPKPKERVRIRFMSRAHSKTALMRFPQIIDDYFETAHPEIQVDVEPAPEGWQQKLLTAMIAGNADDVFQAWPDIFYEWTERDLILDIQPYVDQNLSQEEINDYIEAQWKRLVIRGIRVGMPKYIDMRLESINLDLFDEFGVEYPPKDGDWDYLDFEEMAAKLTRDRDGDGKIDTWGAHLELGGWFYWPRMFGGGIVNPDDNTDCWLDEPGSQECYKWIYKNQWEREPNIFAQPAQVDNQWYYEAWVPELVVIAEKGLYPAMTVEKVQGKFRWDYREPPKGPVRRCTLGDADAWSIWKGSKHPDAAWELIYFLSGPIFQQKGTLEAEGAVPIRKSLMPVMIKVFRENFPPLKDVYLEVIPKMINAGYLENVYWFKNQTAAMEIIDPAMEAVFGVGEKDPTYFKEICAKVEETQKG